MEFYAALLSALTMGFLGGAHCLFMCGGVVGALGFATREGAPLRSWLTTSAYNLGRIASYALLGALLGKATHSLAAHAAMPHTFNVARIVAGLILIAMGLYLADWWRGIMVLERVGQRLWRYLQPLARPWIPVTTVRGAFIVGMVWGWLPCGLVYSALAYSATRASALESALSMFAFGVGTLPAMFTGGLFAHKLKALLARQRVRAVVALPIVLFGIWTLWAALPMAH